jgi:hypothetical protein
MQTERLLSAPGKSSAMLSHSSGLNFSETRYLAGLRMPAHQHGPASFSFVLEGGYTETLGARERECKPLTSIFHPQCESHSVVFHQSEVRIFRVEFGDAWGGRMGDKLAVCLDSFNAVFREPQANCQFAPHISEEPFMSQGDALKP